MKYLLIIILFSFSIESYPQCNADEIFLNDSTNAFCSVIDGKVRKIFSNNLPNHTYGTWPSGNPVEAQEFSYQLCAFPQKSSQATSIYDSGDFNGCSPYVEFGVSANGIRMAPFGARWFVNPNTQEENKEWNVEALVMFSMDFNNSHSNGAGEYHYHGIPINYFIDSLNIDGTQHSPIVGYAADGFPIYYKYLYSDPQDSNSPLSTFDSGHSLRSGNRPGDGVTAPDGAYDGLYIEDYEFIDSNWPLDECNGRFGITPEYPEGTYHYVMTDSWPYIPRCLYGTVIDNAFRIGPNCPDSNTEDCSEEPLHILENISTQSISISPNPSSSIIRIEGLSSEAINLISQVTIYNNIGKVCYLLNMFEDTIDISNLTPGNYFIQINFENYQLTKKLVIQ